MKWVFYFYGPPEAEVVCSTKLIISPSHCSGYPIVAQPAVKKIVQILRRFLCICFDPFIAVPE